MRLSRPVLLALLLVCLIGIAPVGAQVAPNQPTPPASGHRYEGLEWNGEWPDSVTIGNFEDDDGAPTGLRVQTDRFVCMVADASMSGLEGLWAESGAIWTPDDAERSVTALAGAFARRTDSAGIGFSVAVGETGEPLQFLSRDHAWALLYYSGGEGEITIFVELWITSPGNAVLLYCGGPGVADFNSAFGEFSTIRGGISFPDHEFDPAGEPFAGFSGAAASPTPAGSASDAAEQPGSDRSFQTGFFELARFMPELPAREPDGRAPHVMYADIAWRAETFGLTEAADPDDPDHGDWIFATLGLLTPWLFDYGDFIDQTTFGFEVAQIDQSLVLVGSDADITLLRGRFDAAALEAAWLAADYHVETIQGMDVFVFHEDGYIDFENPISAIAVGSMNYAAVLAEGTLVFASTRAEMERVVLTALGDAPSLADSSGVRQLVSAARADLASAVIIDGTSFAVENIAAVLDNPNIPPEERERQKEELEALADRSGLLSGMRLVLLADSVGGPWRDPDNVTMRTPDALAEIAILFDTTEAAQQASVIIPARLSVMTSATSRVPYTDLVELVDARVDDAAPVAIIDLAYRDTLTGWLYRSWSSNDLRFLYHEAS